MYTIILRTDTNRIKSFLLLKVMLSK